MKKIKLIFVLLFFSTCLVYSQEKRVALLCGIEEYSGVFQSLPTSVKDAKTMQNLLEAIGFETPIVSPRNANRKELTDLLGKFEESAKHADVALFYFSGHGLSKTNKGNSIPDMYLVPSGKYKIDGSLYRNSLELDAVRKTLEETDAKYKICIIDACRSSFDSKGPTIYQPDIIIESIEKLEKVKGIVYFFSTSEGEKSYTEDQLSVFTNSLVNHLADPVNMETIWERVQKEVSQKYPSQRPECVIGDKNRDKNLLKNWHFYQGIRPINPEYIKKGQGSVSINLSPANAKITFLASKNTYQNGSSILLPFGQSYEYVVSAEGYQDYQNAITLHPNSSNKLEAKLAKTEPASLYVKTKVSGVYDFPKGAPEIKDANVYFDGQYIGKTPLSINTLSGHHSISFKHKNYYESNTSVNLSPGDQMQEFYLNKNNNRWNNFRDYSGGEVSYHYNSKMPIGISGMGHIVGSRFSIGGLISFSPAIFRGWSVFQEYPNIYSSEYTLTIDNYQYKNKTETLNFPSDYSSDIDPDDEAKHYDSNFSALVLGDYHFCNLFALECGVGASMHQDKYKMDDAYQIEKKSIINPNSNEVIGDPSYSLKKSGVSHVFNNKPTWSPALRVGTKFYIPLGRDYSYNSICLGIGYMYNPILPELNTFDFSIGVKFSD